MMKLLIILLTTLTLSLTVHAKEIVVNASYLADQQYKIALDMPCDWDGDLNTTMLYGYYGEQKEQHPITPNSVNIFGDNLLLDLSPGVANLNGLPLVNIAVEYPETGARCKTGFGMDQLSK